MSRSKLRTAATVVLAIVACGVQAAGTYQRPDAFISEAFAGDPPEPDTVWLIEDLGQAAADILGHPPRQLRERYWLRAGRSAWILEEIGKERPITVGWVVADGAIVQTRVLIYRETRGWEVRYPYFTDQMQGARLNTQHELDQRIDGISGATLSVDAMRNMARLALLLDARVTGHATP